MIPNNINAASASWREKYVSCRVGLNGNDFLAFALTCVYDNYGTQK